VVLGTARRSEGVPADWRERFTQAYVDELQAWIAGLAAGVVSGPSAWDGYAATALAACAVDSFAKGTRVDVVLPAKPGLYA
jgi:myo-inositol 2-dehydrogenase/D-chiro-inositol 1-dehydrogenase